MQVITTWIPWLLWHYLIRKKDTLRAFRSTEFCFVCLFFIASEYIIIHLLIYIFFSVCIIFYKYSKLITRNISQTLTLQDLIKLIIIVIFVCLLIYFRFCSFQWRFSSSTSSYLNEPHKFQELGLSCQPEAEEKNATKVKTRWRVTWLYILLLLTNITFVSITSVRHMRTVQVICEVLTCLYSGFNFDQLIHNLTSA